MEISGQFIKMLNIELQQGPETLLLGIYQRKMKTYVYKDLRKNVYGNIIHKSQKVESTQTSIHWWIDKQNMLNPYSGIVLVNKKGSNADTCNNVDKLPHYSEWKKTQKTTYCVTGCKFSPNKVVKKHYVQ